jgi:uncharacterized protein YqhQ
LIGAQKKANRVLLACAAWGAAAARDDDVSAACGHGGPEDRTIGGQAVLEGVMMRGRGCWGLAVRRPSGGIAERSFPLEDRGARYPVLKWPIIRGVFGLWDSLSLGIKALGLSANLSLEEAEQGEGDSEAGKPSETVAEAGVGEAGASSPTEGPPQLGFKELALTVGIAVLFAVVLFVVIPLAIVKFFEATFSNPFVFNLVEGLIRIVIFILYVVIISFIPDLRRVFQYHGAEHKAINAYEAGEPLDPDHARRFSTIHPRCGTAFLLVVMVLAVLVFAVIGKPALQWLVLSRLVGIPLVAGLAYEVVRYAGRHRGGFVARFVLWPGLALQRLTTREPSDDQVEVAIAVLREVLRVEAGGAPLAAAPAQSAASS